MCEFILLPSRPPAIMDRTRAAIKEVIPCDANEEEIIFDPSKGPFDFIVSSYCLEAACTSLKSYNQAVSKLSKLLNPGGKLFLAGNLEETFYKVQGNLFDHLPVTKNDVGNAIESAGMVLESFECASTKDLEEFTGDNKGTYCVVAMKK